MNKIGKYEILEKIGGGGMGAVYRARDPMLGRDVAIKVISENILPDVDMRERFYREARASGMLQHENLTIVHDVGECDGQPYIVMEYLKGKNLRAIISARTPLPLLQKLDYARQICKGLEFVHSENIIHRDIKPENLMVLDGGKVKVLDFGIAKPITSHLTQSGMRIGTPLYMSPEQIKGNPVDKRTDIFSFGILFYELLMYKRPFDGDDATVMYQIIHEEPAPLRLEAPEMADDLQALISGCLAKPAKDRCSSFSELLNGLERLIAKLQNQQRINALFAEAEALRGRGNFQEALAYCDEILKIEPQQAQAKMLRQEMIAKEKQRRSLKVMAGEIIGETISHYLILERLGAGGMGMVYKAEDTKLNRPVALKFLLPELCRDENAMRRFIREAQATSALDHVNICNLHEIGETDSGQLFICMTYYEGKTLRSVINEKSLDIPSALDIALQIAAGIAKAHEHGIVHRDLKPGNIIVTKDGVVKIVDFGIAKLAGATKLTRTGATLGTLAYMSPEQCKGLDTDHRTDIWALGVILYEMLAGQLPFSGENEFSLLYVIVNENPVPASQLNAAISPAIEGIIQKALQKPLDQRFATMKEMRELLLKIRRAFERETKERTETRSKIDNLMAKGKLYLEYRKYDEALYHFKIVLELDPNNRQAAELAAECERQLNELQKTETLLANAEFYLEQKNYEQATETYQEILSRDPQNQKALAGIKRAEMKKTVATSRPAEISIPSLPKPRLEIFKNIFGRRNLILFFVLGMAALVIFLLQKQEFKNSTPPEKSAEKTMPATLQAIIQETNKARAQAETNQAALYAREIFESAKGKENAANLALQAKQYAAAESLLIGAQEEYLNAAKTASAVVASLKSEPEATTGKEVAPREAPESKPAEKSAEKENLESLKMAVNDAEQKANLARRNAEVQRAKDDAEEAYAYAEQREGVAAAAIAGEDYSAAIEAFREAKQGYERALVEMSALQSARKFYQIGDYENCLPTLTVALRNAPYAGENKKARELLDAVTRDKNLRDQKFADADAAVNNGNLKRALQLLDGLSLRDRDRVNEKQEEIIKRDQEPPAFTHVRAKNYAGGKSFTIRWSVRDNLNVRQVQLYYQRKGENAYIPVEMKLTSEGDYEFSISPDYHKGKEIRYYFFAKDINGNASLYFSKDNPITIKSKDEGITPGIIP